MARKAKSRVINVRLLSMAMTGYFYTFTRLRTAPPMSMIKYDPIDNTYINHALNMISSCSCVRILSSHLASTMAG
ncbi:hypothetical protein VTJ49DRAFT_2284 [Mycothermus thermophilus]|uniref:Large ribosomal subunit protein bL33m n=1 Tax=Humicola insolens TaxID=85995 RepID=A0ABR3VA33_HUMIN